MGVGRGATSTRDLGGVPNSLFRSLPIALKRGCRGMNWGLSVPKNRPMTWAPLRPLRGNASFDMGSGGVPQLLLYSSLPSPLGRWGLVGGCAPYTAPGVSPVPYFLFPSPLQGERGPGGVGSSPSTYLQNVQNLTPNPAQNLTPFSRSKGNKYIEADKRPLSASKPSHRMEGSAYQEVGWCLGGASARIIPASQFGEHRQPVKPKVSSLC
jgi:hypothetical protein